MKIDLSKVHKDQDGNPALLEVDGKLEVNPKFKAVHDGPIEWNPCTVDEERRLREKKKSSCCQP